MAVRVVECLGPEHGAEDSEQSPGPPIDPGSRSPRSLGPDDKPRVPRGTKAETVAAIHPTPTPVSQDHWASLYKRRAATSSTLHYFFTSRGASQSSMGEGGV